MDHYGWICPRCLQVWSPNIARCRCAPEKYIIKDKVNIPEEILKGLQKPAKVLPEED